MRAYEQTEGVIYKGVMIMELDQMLTAAANYGFPMLVSCYLLVRMENKIDQLSANIDALTRVIAAAK